MNTCGIKAEVQVHETSIHGGVFCCLLHLWLGLRLRRKKMKGVPHRRIGHHCLQDTIPVQITAYAAHPIFKVTNLQSWYLCFFCLVMMTQQYLLMLSSHTAVIQKRL